MGRLVPIDVALRVQDQLLQKGFVTRGRLGVGIQDVNQALAESFGLKKPAGALVSSVEKGSPAAKAGIEPGDVIVRYNGSEVGTSSQLPVLVANTKPGEVAKVDIVRKGDQRSLDITVGELKPDAGKVGWGVSVQIGYFPQDHKEALPSGTTPFEWLTTFAPQEPHEYVRGFLGRMLFRGPEQDKSTQSLSGGERARVLFSKLMMDGANVMILDEPTNHLDLESITALNDALREFQGSLIFVSHDIDFITSLANRVLEIDGSGGYRFMDISEFTP